MSIYFGICLWGDWRWKLVWIDASLAEYTWNGCTQFFIVSQWTFRHVPQKSTLLTSVWERTKLLLLRDDVVPVSRKNVWSGKHTFPQNAQRTHEKTKNPEALGFKSQQIANSSHWPVLCPSGSSWNLHSLLSSLCAAWWDGMTSLLVDRARDQEPNSYFHSLPARWAEKIPSTGFSPCHITWIFLEYIF